MNTSFMSRVSRKVLAPALALGLGLGLALGGEAQAVDIKAKGLIQSAITWSHGPLQGPGADKAGTGDRFNASTRVRTQLDIIASESLKGVVFLQLGQHKWGHGGSGGSLGTDGIQVKVRYAYVDFVVPNTPILVRAGLQPVDIETYAVPMAALSTRSAGLTVIVPFNENVTLAALWLRPYNDNGAARADGDTTRDALDAFALALPMNFDGVKINPFGIYARAGRDTFTGAEPRGFGGGNNATGVPAGLLPVGAAGAAPLLEDKYGNAWWAGISTEITLASPLRFAFDAVYGSVDLGSVGTQDVKRSGWYAAIAADYKLDNMTPGLVAWYASGDDSNPLDGSERMPELDTDVALTHFGFDGGNNYNYGCLFTGTTLSGSWGVMAQVRDMSFIEDLTHHVSLLYMQGTNDTDMAAVAGGMTGVANSLYLTTKDKLVEFNLSNEYAMYENLTLGVDLGYIYLDADEDLWGTDVYRKHNYLANFSVNYRF